MNNNTFDNFVFYGSWRETLEGMREDFGEDYAKEALWNIMLAATAGDIETEKKFIISFISGAVMPNINKAKDRYAAAVENGKKGGRKKIELNQEEVMRLKAELKTWKAVAAHLKVDEDTLRKCRKEWEKTEKPKNLDIDIDKDIDIDIEKEKDIDIETQETEKPKNQKAEEIDEKYDGAQIFVNLPPEMMRAAILADLDRSIELAKQKELRGAM